MDTNNLQGQAGRGNVQDNSTGKTESKQSTVNSHNTTITVHGVGETLIIALVLLALIGTGLLLIWQPWNPKPVAPLNEQHGSKPEQDTQPSPTPQILVTMPVKSYQEGDRFAAEVTATAEGYLYVVSISATGDPFIIFPHAKRQSAKVAAQETISLATEIINPATGQMVPLTLRFPSRHAGNEVHERLVFFLCDHELMNTLPATVDAKAQRTALLQAKLLEAEDLDRIAAGDELSPISLARLKGVVQTTETYTLRRKKPEPVPASRSDPR
jgi:hypothetical protein